MAGNKINTKTKTKDDKAKNRNPSPSNEDTEEPDFTLLRKPIHTSITGFAQARKVFDVATEELKTLLTNECDIIYECKVCRNIFRSLANFISHKRIYCKETFDSSVHGHFVRTLSAASEISRIKKLEELCNVSLKDENLAALRKEWEDRIPLSKDLTEIIERLVSTKGCKQKEETPQVVLQEIPKSNVAVFQNIKGQEDNVADMMRAQVNELYNMMSKENAVLKSDGTVEEQGLTNKGSKDTENVIQISDDDELGEGDILKCKICDLQFSTQKTLKFHMKYKHLESRLVYPCPDCLEIFSTSWSVYRHLFKVHRKTAAQIRRQRESIQAKAFRMNNPPAFYEKRKNNVKNTSSQKITEEERLEQENQAWMDNLEGDGEVPRCGGCGRTFERRAALAAHTHTCQSRSRALARRPPDSRKIEIQIRKDYNKAPPPSIALPLKITESNGNKQINEEVPDQSKLQEKESVSIEKEKSKKDEHEKSTDTSPSKQNVDDTFSNKNINNCLNFIKLPFARQTEISNFNAFNKQCQLDIAIDKLQCKRCNNTFSKDSDLYEHMAEHYKWLRYACKLCNFKHYNFDKLPEHVRLIHKLKGDTDFYYSTVKAIDGVEAFQLSECSKIINEHSEKSPNSRRPSRCSSDSSRLSDDSSCSSTRAEGARKRKMKYNKATAKKKKEMTIEDTDDLKDSEGSNDLVDETESASNIKLFEENSSDIEELEEKQYKKPEVKSAITISSSRPVRKRTNKKNEDFEYDLSNLLKMEAQGYRDSQAVITPKQVPTKKKSSVENQSDTNINKYANEHYNNDYAGALAAVAKKEVAAARAHMRCPGRSFQGNARNVFLRPSLPKFVRTEKISPKKDAEIPRLNKSEKQEVDNSKVSENGVGDKIYVDISIVKEPDEDSDITDITNKFSDSNVFGKNTSSMNKLCPVKVRRPSLDIINDPSIKKNIADFSETNKKSKVVILKSVNNNDEVPNRYQKVLSNTLSEPVRIELPITNTYTKKYTNSAPDRNTKGSDDNSHKTLQCAETVIKSSDDTLQSFHVDSTDTDSSSKIIINEIDKLLYQV